MWKSRVAVLLLASLGVCLMGCTNNNDPDKATTEADSAAAGQAAPEATPQATPQHRALAWLQANPDAHGLENPAEELRLRRVDKVDPELSLVRFDQYYKNIPLLGQQLRVHLDGAGEVTEVSGEYIKTPVRIATMPGSTKEQARAAAATLVPDVPENCAACPIELAYLVPQRGTRPHAVGPQLVWQVDAVVNAINGQRLLLHGNSLSLLQSLPLALSGG